MYLLDTHVLLWRLFNPEYIPGMVLGKLREQERVGRVFYSSISTWEIGIKVKNGKLELPLSMEQLVRAIRASGALQAMEVTEDIWLENLGLDWPHRDPADRTIVATARLYGLTLVTKDENIRSFAGVNTLW